MADRTDIMGHVTDHGFFEYLIFFMDLKRRPDPRLDLADPEDKQKTEVTSGKTEIKIHCRNNRISFNAAIQKSFQ